MMTSANQKKSGTGEIMLFGVRLVVDSMRKCVSLNNLSEYEQPLDSSNSNNVDVAGGYASADEAAVAARSSAVNRERKRGVPWTEDEHKLFLVGLEKIGKGDWRGISRNFVKTRTPTQVASHAQKYFLRRNNLNRRRRRSSLFDITGDSVCANPINDQKIGINGSSFEIGSQSPPPPPPPLLPASVEANSEISAFRFSVPETSRFPAMTTMKLDQTLPIFPATVHPINESTAGFDLSLTLSLSMSSDHQAKSSSSMNSAFQIMQGFNNGDSIISVA